jgi:hypothetical protein
MDKRWIRNGFVTMKNLKKVLISKNKKDVDFGPG